MTTTEKAPSRERADLLASLARQRDFLRLTVRGLTDEQAAQRSTVSELCLGGLIKHVCLVEQQWISFIQEGPSVMASDGDTGPDVEDWSRAFRMLEGETLARGPLVRAGRELVGAAGAAARDRGDGPACGPRRYYPRDPGRR